MTKGKRKKKKKQQMKQKRTMATTPFKLTSMHKNIKSVSDNYMD